MIYAIRKMCQLHFIESKAHKATKQTENFDLKLI